MAQRTITVCWTPSQTTSNHAFLSDQGAQYTGDVIAVVEPTTFKVVTSKACSDPSVYPFAMKIAHDMSNGDITVIAGEGQTIAFSANYKVVNQSRCA